MDGPNYREWRPAPELRGDVACTWIGHIGSTGVAYTDRVLPDGCIDIIWDGRRLFVAGPDTGPVPMAAPSGTTFIGIRFRTGHARPALAMPAADLCDLRPDLAEVWGGRPAEELEVRLAAAASPHAAMAVLQEAVRARARHADPVDPLVDGIVAMLTSGGPRGPGMVARLSDRLGLSERSLHRRCATAVGYGAKTLDRVLRFRRALDLGRSQPTRSMGAIAAASGYADQAHFTRDCGRLAGLTPSELFKTRV